VRRVIIQPDGREIRLTDLERADFEPTPPNPDTEALRARTRRVLADANCPDSPLHDAAVAEVAAIRAAGWGRCVEGLEVWAAELRGGAA
jgi:hypothetical protein